MGKNIVANLQNHHCASCSRFSPRKKDSDCNIPNPL